MLQVASVQTDFIPHPRRSPPHTPLACSGTVPCVSASSAAIQERSSMRALSPAAAAQCAHIRLGLQVEGLLPLAAAPCAGNASCRSGRDADGVDHPRQAAHDPHGSPGSSTPHCAAYERHSCPETDTGRTGRRSRELPPAARQATSLLTPDGRWHQRPSGCGPLGHPTPAPAGGRLKGLRPYSTDPSPSAAVAGADNNVCVECVECVVIGAGEVASPAHIIIGGIAACKPRT